MAKWAKLATLAGGGLVAGMLIREAVQRRRKFDFRGKSVLITGGSRGLGLVLARKLAERGARLTIAARTQADLDDARLQLQQLGAEVHAVACDVRDKADVQRLVEYVLTNYGTVDVLINNAGIIEVGPMDAMTLEDFNRSMDTHCWGTLNTVRAVLPTMRRQGWGRIVNIASLGGKRAVPHMLPYSASKFALVGLSNGLRAELAQENIFVTTICPSLMRTGSPRNAIFKGQHRKEYAWFSIGDSLPLVAMSAERAADQILDACQRGTREKIIRNPANAGVLVQSMLPGLTQDALVLIARWLPAMGGIGLRPARGYESESDWSRSNLTRLTRRAARKNNEMRPHPIRLS